jgi:hypothetical protein
MNMHIPRWLIFAAVGAFALFEVVTHAPGFINAFGTQQAQQQQNVALKETALAKAQAETLKAEADAQISAAKLVGINADITKDAGSSHRLETIEQGAQMRRRLLGLPALPQDTTSN